MLGMAFPALCLSLSLLVGCAPLEATSSESAKTRDAGSSPVVVPGVWPITSGFHTPIPADAPVKKYRFVVWGNHPGVVNAIIEQVQRGGHTVVERARLQEIFDEQKIRLMHTPDDEADVLRVGRLVGAERVIFAEVTIRPENVSSAFVGPYGGVSRSDTVYHLSVAIRGVNVETGEIRWSGSATYPTSINNPEQGAVFLTNWALARANCQTERGFQWVEPGGGREGGCRPKE